MKVGEFFVILNTMKLKLFLTSIFILLSLVAYKTYRDTVALKSIDSYESCIASKGSLIQESYPATCITRLGTRFPEPIKNSQIDDSWKIFVNITKHYTFLYPPDQTVNAENLSRVIIGGRGIHHPLYAPLSITTYPNPQKLSLRDWFKSTYPNDLVTAQYFEDFEINNIRGIKYHNPSSSLDSYYILGPNIILSFAPIDSGTTPEEINIQNMENLTIISTVKFTD